MDSKLLMHQSKIVELWQLELRIDVMRKPQKCPVCGENVVDIIYGTGEMTNLVFLLQYRREGIVAGDYIPRRPPIWACRCGCKRFRKVNWDGTDAEVKPKMLKNIRPKTLTIINFTTELASEAFEKEGKAGIHHYTVKIETEFGEKDELSITAVTDTDAKEEARDIIYSGRYGHRGEKCVKIEVEEKEDI